MSASDNVIDTPVSLEGHTPGPWGVKEDSIYFYVFEADTGGVVALVPRDPTGLRNVEERANAELISLAPYLVDPEAGEGR